MEQSTYDPCLLHYSKDSQFGIVGLQTDDTLFLANTSFADAEESKLRKAQFSAKECTVLTTTTPLKFNGSLIELHDDGSISLTQERQVQNLGLVYRVLRSTLSSKRIVRKNFSLKE